MLKAYPPSNDLPFKSAPPYYLFPPLQRPLLSANYKPMARKLSAQWRTSFPGQCDVANILDDLVAFSSSLELENARAMGDFRLTLALRLRQCTSYHALLSLRDGSVHYRWMLQEPFRLASLMYLYEISCYDGLSFMLQRQPPMLRRCLKSGQDVN